MKKTRQIILFIVIIGLATGCSSSNKADSKVSCQIESTSEGGTFKGVSVLEYNSSTDALIKTTIDESYTNLEKTKINNNILTNIMDRQSKLDGIDGVELTLDVQDTSFTVGEVWDFKKVDPQAAFDVDPDQKYLIDSDTYTYTAYRHHLEEMGYSCE